MSQFNFHTLIDFQLVNEGLFPSGMLAAYGAPRLGGMYDYVMGSIDHWVERDAEFDPLVAVDDVVQSPITMSSSRWLSSGCGCG